MIIEGARRWVEGGGEAKRLKAMAEIEGGNSFICPE